MPQMYPSNWLILFFFLMMGVTYYSVYLQYQTFSFILNDNNKLIITSKFYFKW